MEDKSIMYDCMIISFLKHLMIKCLKQKVWIHLRPHQINSCASHTGVDEISESETSSNGADKTEASCCELHKEDHVMNHSKIQVFWNVTLVSCIAITFRVKQSKHFFFSAYLTRSFKMLVTTCPIQ